MLYSHFRLFGVFALLCLAGVLPAQSRLLATFQVSAGHNNRQNTPVSAALEGLPVPVYPQDFQLIEITGGRNTPVDWQIAAGQHPQLHWILSGDTPAGAVRSFELRTQSSSNPAPKTGLSVKKAGGALTINAGETPVLRYQYDEQSEPKGSNPLFRRGGFIHPLWSPKGEVLTRIQPPDHHHHYGIWNPWTETEFEHRHLDFWNLYKGQGTVKAHEPLSWTAGPVFAGFSAWHEHVDLTAPSPTGAKTALNETWEVRAWNADPGKKVWIVDFTSNLACATDSIFTIKAYRYQGFGFRATEKWDDTNSRLLTSEGFDKSNGNATRARWCDVRGVSSSGESGIVFMTHPSNYNFPEQLRIWPTGSNNNKENVFFNFNPAQEQDWVLQPGQNYSLHYRMLVYDGQYSPAEMERYWQDFAHPPQVTTTFYRGPANPRILVYTKNGKGYVHDNIPATVEALKKMGAEQGWQVDASDDPAVMTEENLKNYQALVFSNTNNETFDTEAQKLAFQRYIQAGGGFVGIHSACGSERSWPWFWKLVGGKFVRHPPLQPFDIEVVDHQHPITAHLEKTWPWEDECYYTNQLNPDIKVLLSADLRTVEDPKMAEYPGITFGNRFPLSWYHHFEGSRQWYTALGHKGEYYSDPKFVKLLSNGINWVLAGSQPLDYKKSTDSLILE